MKRTLNRRRFIGISAATMGLVMAPYGAKGALGVQPYRWRGVAMGADAEMSLYHDDIDVAEKLTKACLAEVRRLEKIFSLYRPNSAVSQLNTHGELHNPPIELVDLLSRAATISELTNGAFDITVQSLWRLYHDHFTGGGDVAGPSEDALRNAMARVNYRAVDVQPDAISFSQPDMAITLNGIAQGYITDAVTNFLRDAGMAHVLVNMGEIRALGSHADGQPWHIGLGTNIDEPIELMDRAVATSAGAGMVFPSSENHHHLFDPHTGLSTQRWQQVSVIAPNATLADALSTAFMAMDEPEIRAVASTFSCNVIATSKNMRQVSIQAI